MQWELKDGVDGFSEFRFFLNADYKLTPVSLNRASFIHSVMNSALAINLFPFLLMRIVRK